MLNFKTILNIPSPLQQLNDSLFEEKGLKVFVKRDDLIHPEISGNKWRKLKYNLLNARKLGYEKLLTFGGAYSNHIYAMAAAGKYFDFETIGIIRGDELNESSSPTLKFASECGMKLIFVSRGDYRNKEVLQRIYENQAFIIPEGGTNELALDGVGEMVNEIRNQLGYEPDYIICPIGTGGTIAGIVQESSLSTHVIGVCVLMNGYYLLKEINHLVKGKTNFEIDWDSHHGGYAKSTPELLNFNRSFEVRNEIKIDPIYSGKMFYAFYELLIERIEPLSTVVLIHTGGLQYNQ